MPTNKNYLYIASLFVIVVILLGVSCGTQFTEPFNHITVGIGTLLAGLGGLIAFINWSEKLKNKSWVNYVKKNFPKEEKGNKFDLFRLDSRHIFIFDKDKKVKHHIEDMPTFYYLDYEYGDWTDVSSNKLEVEFKKYESGKSISLF